MGFRFTKGYLAVDDLAWGADEFLQGSEQVNDCCVAAWTDGYGSTRTFAIYATDADLVVVNLHSNRTAGESILNTLAGYASRQGGFFKVSWCGDMIYAIPKNDPTKVCLLGFDSLNGGDSTPSEWTSVEVGTEVYDLHCSAIDGADSQDNELAYVSLAGEHPGEYALVIFHLKTGSSFMASTPSKATFPKGSSGNHLYYLQGGFLHVVYDPVKISGGDFRPDVSYGRVKDDFSGTTIDGEKWTEVLDDGMTSCFSQDDALVFNTSVSANSASGSLIYNAVAAGVFGINVRYHVSAWPSNDDMNSSLCLILGNSPKISSETSTIYTLRKTRTQLIVAVEENDTEIFTESRSLDTDTGRLFIARDFGNGTHRILYGYENAQGEWVSYFHTFPVENFTPLFSALQIRDNTGLGGFRGSLSDFRALDDLPEITVAESYTTLPDQNVVACGLSPQNDDGVRTFAFAYAARAMCILSDESDKGGESESAQHVGPEIVSTREAGTYPILVSAALTCACVDDESQSAFFGGGAGISQIDLTDLDAPSLRRNYTTVYDHAQPLVDKNVRCIDFSDAGFAYGADSDLYGSGSYGSGGGGYIEPDFDAPQGSDAWARARHLNEIDTGADTPSPKPADFLHAHAERRVGGGEWYRLKDSGWTLVSEIGWDHSTDVEFLTDAALGDIGVVIQDESLVPGQYEYRWVYHDQAGNQGEVTAATVYDGNSEYIDTPKITGFLVKAADGSTTASGRGVLCSVSGNAGDACGNTAPEKIYQVRFWNDGESESDSEWRDYEADRSYPHLLTAGDGVKTIHARVRHTSGAESESCSASIILTEGASGGDESAAHENLILCFGSLNGYNFTGDSAAALSATSEDSDFPAVNVQHYDLSAPWKSTYSGAESNPNRPWGTSALEFGGQRISFQAWLKWDLAVSKRIDAFAIFEHNFSLLKSYAESGGGEARVVLYASDTGSDFPADANLWTLDLSERTEEKVILQRPTVSRRHWGLLMSLSGMELSRLQSMIGAREPWSVGRVVLNESSLCYQAPYNYDERLRETHRDPSKVSETVGQARRVVEMRPYRVLDLRFRDLTPEEAQPFMEIWRRQRQIRPVLVLPSPQEIPSGDEAPRSVTVEARGGAIYGYLGDGLQVEGGGWRHSDVRLTITEAVG